MVEFRDCVGAKRTLAYAHVYATVCKPIKYKTFCPESSMEALVIKT